VLALLAVLAAMGGLTAAAVPLYRIFCGATGYGGTTQVAHEAPSQVLERTITVRFNTDVSPQLPWTFDPPAHPVRVKVGETALVYFHARNNSDRAITGHAVYNVAPDKAGLYFDKIQCFCFTEQTLKPGQTAEMPVSFFVDPAIMKDRNLDDIETITLSYTFFRAKDQAGETKKQVSHDAAPGVAVD
jgi:cytochrome c oxidase assembly protein subunit 11